MNYRHGYHAGNFADVVKHLALVTILQHLQKKDAAFAVIDSHAGRGLYDLSGDEARRTGEALNGIARLTGLPVPLPENLAAYREMATDQTDMYPGSPLLAARMLRPQDRLAAAEKHPVEYAALEDALSPFRKARVIAGDGYHQLAALLPPPERRGLVLIDPPFEATDEFETMAAAMGAAWRRWPTGIYLIWFPVKDVAGAARFCAEMLQLGADRALRIDIDTGGDEGLTRAGVLILNPPYGFDDKMKEALDLIAPRLGANGKPARVTMATLAV